MNKQAGIAVALSLLAGVTACDQPSPTTPEGPSPSLALVSTPGVVQAPIEGTIISDRNFPWEDLLTTPSGNCHYTHFDNESTLTGTITGSVVYERRIMNNSPCGPDGTGSTINFSGPVHGTVTYDGRTGDIEGQGHGHCDYDPTSIVPYACGGVYNLRGTGELEGVQFHIEWGPGWFPFHYEGTASSH